MEEFEKQINAKLQQKIKFYEEKHKQELKALKQRIHRGRDELLSQKKQAWERLKLIILKI